ncbi:MAG: hypothetical protein IJV20_05140 [Prevotella sp.]|nr:hypothetical protein [Prevotella sp.]
MTYRLLWSCLITGCLLLTDCADRPEEDLSQPEYEGPPLQLGAVTRTDGATSYSGNQDIRIYLTNEAGMVKEDGEFSASGWTSNLNVKEESQYYIYGFMPKTITGATITYRPPTGENYANGIDLSFTGLPAITTDDICVVVGVQRVASATSTANVTEGNYSYLSGINTQNYVNLLMAHLYTGLEVKFKLDADYAKLRSIHLKECKLSYTYGTVSATVNIRAGQGIGSPDFTKTSGSETTFSLLETTDTEVVLDNTTTSTAVSLKQAYCAPCLFTDNTSITITSTYDVYDKKNIKLGERTSVNKLNTAWPASTTAAPGLKKTVTLTVKPTYLYILSDNDLDNPVIQIE